MEANIQKPTQADTTFIDNLEVSVLRLSETIDQKIKEAQSIAEGINESASTIAYSTLENLKEKQREIEGLVKRVKNTIMPSQ